MKWKMTACRKRVLIDLDTRQWLIGVAAGRSGITLAFLCLWITWRSKTEMKHLAQLDAWRTGSCR